MTDPRQHVTLVGHSPVIYWWPAILVAFAIGGLSWIAGEQGPNGGAIYPSNNPGLFFLTTILLLIVFTNANLRGIYSFLTITVIAFVVVLFAWLGWWDAIFEFIPQLSAKANAGFYFVFGTVLSLVWLASFLFFDRTTYWVIYPGQIVEQRVVGGASNSHDTNALVFEHLDRNVFKHTILGLGAGDVRMSSPGQDPVLISNVLFVDEKTKRAQELVAIKPDEAEEAALVMPRAQ